MSLVPYLFFDGRAREALEFYRDVFGGELELHTLEEFGRVDGDPAAIAHGSLTGVVALFAADEGGSEVRMSGLVLSLLGAADAASTARWFSHLAAGGTVTDPLQQRVWGDHDGQVTDRFGIRWLLGHPG